MFLVTIALRAWWQKELMIGQGAGDNFPFLPQDPVIPPLGAYPREVTVCVHRDMYKNTQSSLIQSNLKLQTTQTSISGWIDKEIVVYP